MLTETTTARNSLEGFAAYLDGYWSDQPFNTAISGGWNSLPLTRADLSGRVRALSERLDRIRDEDINEDLKRKLKILPDQLAWFQNNTLPQLPTGNLPTVIANFDILLGNIEQSLPFSPLPDWQEVADSALVPRDLARRIRNLDSAISRLEPKVGSLDEKLKAINDAHSAALDLPTDLQSLKEARDEVERHRRESVLASERMADALKTAEISNNAVKEHEKTAAQLITNIDAAYSAATTAGLAASFTERARSLTQSTRLWVGLLGAALLVGAIIGYVRLESFQEMVQRPSMDPQILWINAAMSLLSIAAPVWFAWLATRQIGQRFRLAEDYAFKASVARAYEGYRKEAARLDTELEARLFASALDRLDEAPLRFLSVEEHGSPYESLLASAGFQKALEKVPSLRDAVAVAIERAGGTSRAPADPTP